MTDIWALSVVRPSNFGERPGVEEPAHLVLAWKKRKKRISSGLFDELPATMTDVKKMKGER